MFPRIRIPFFITFRFNEETPKQRGKRVLLGQLAGYKDMEFLFGKPSRAEDCSECKAVSTADKYGTPNRASKQGPKQIPAFVKGEAPTRDSYRSVANPHSSLLLLENLLPKMNSWAEAHDSSRFSSTFRNLEGSLSFRAALLCSEEEALNPKVNVAYWV